jgi:hypothetical protein
MTKTSTMSSLENPMEHSLNKLHMYVLVEHVYPLADYVLDVHSGDGNERLGPSYTAYYGKAGSDSVIQASKNMAIAFGLDLMVEFQWELQPHDGTDGDYDGIQIRQKADAFTESNEGLTAPGGRTLHAIYIPCTMYAYAIIAPFRKFYGIWSHSQTKVESKILKAILDETT